MLSGYTGEGSQDRRTPFPGPNATILKVPCAVEDILGMEHEIPLIARREELFRHPPQISLQGQIRSVSIYDDAADNDDRLAARSASFVEKGYPHDSVSAKGSAHLLLGVSFCIG